MKQLYNDNLRKFPNEYGDFSVMPDTRAALALACVKKRGIQEWRMCGVSYLYYLCFNTTCEMYIHVCSNFFYYLQNAWY